jgi:hypothetical protein
LTDVQETGVPFPVAPTAKQETFLGLLETFLQVIPQRRNREIFSLRIQMIKLQSGDTFVVTARGTRPSVLLFKLGRDKPPSFLVPGDRLLLLSLRQEVRN